MGRADRFGVGEFLNGLVVFFGRFILVVVRFIDGLAFVSGLRHPVAFVVDVDDDVIAVFGVRQRRGRWRER